MLTTEINPIPQRDYDAMADLDSIISNTTPHHSTLSNNSATNRGSSPLSNRNISKISFELDGTDSLNGQKSSQPRESISRRITRQLSGSCIKSTSISKNQVSKEETVIEPKNKKTDPSSSKDNFNNSSNNILRKMVNKILRQ